MRRQVHLAETSADQQHDEEFMDTIDEENNRMDQDDSIQDDPGEDQNEDGADGNDDDVDMGELAQVLTLTAKKLSNITLGRKFTNRPKNGPKTKLTAQDKSTTHCSACGGLGHWYKRPRMPQKHWGSGAAPSDKRFNSKGSGPKGSSTHKVGIIHHDYGSLEIHETPEEEYGNVFFSRDGLDIKTSR